MIKENGMVDYATSIVTSSAASSAGKSRQSSNRGSPQSSAANAVPQSAGSSASTSSQYGADIDWILRASGSSRGGNLPGWFGSGSRFWMR